ncbi:MAG: pantoate--beta-alanine ligase [Phycisphaerae bacterium]|nr:pantoate--beta-alanine ligase [Phycisphaerae bacterium]
MKVVNTINQTRNEIATARQQGKSIALVPTMGALHDGHLSLIQQAKKLCDYVAVSIFVNPTQFGPNEDLDKYPRTLDNDINLCESERADLILAPSSKEIYPTANFTWVNVDKLTKTLCGSTRDGHFQGVCTVVAKLFNIFMPDKAFFGQKDAQQLAVIRQMASDLNFPIDIIGCPIIREPDGLAMSSRNRYLSGEQRTQALVINKALQLGQKLFAGGMIKSQDIINKLSKMIQQQPLAKIDYISIVDKDLMHELDTIDRPALLALAVYIGNTRLIDNIVLDPKD